VLFIMLRFIFIISIALSSASFLGCGSETGGDDDAASTSGTGGTMKDPNKVYPEPNGQMITEAVACGLMHDAFVQRKMTLNCGVSTTRQCPGFLQVYYDPDCTMYDQGSVQGCVDHYLSILQCDALIEDVCVPTNYPGTEPSGCP
jgi:hypothetical protein